MENFVYVLDEWSFWPSTNPKSEHPKTHSLVLLKISCCTNFELLGVTVSGEVHLLKTDPYTPVDIWSCKRILFFPTKSQIWKNQIRWYFIFILMIEQIFTKSLHLTYSWVNILARLWKQGSELITIPAINSLQSASMTWKELPLNCKK